MWFAWLVLLHGQAVQLAKKATYKPIIVEMMLDPQLWEQMQLWSNFFHLEMLLWGSWPWRSTARWFCRTVHRCRDVYLEGNAGNEVESHPTYCHTVYVSLSACDACVQSIQRVSFPRYLQYPFSFSCRMPMNRCPRVAPRRLCVLPERRALTIHQSSRSVGRYRRRVAP